MKYMNNPKNNLFFNNQYNFILVLLNKIPIIRVSGAFNFTYKLLKIRNRKNTFI